MRPESFSLDRFLLVPRQHLAYGQDFQIGGMVEHCHLSYLFKEDGGRYHLHKASPELVVSQNPDDPADAELLHELSGKTATVVIQHCRWNYFDELQKANVERSVRSATVCVSPCEFLAVEMKRHFPMTQWRVAGNGVRPDIFRPAQGQERKDFRLKHMISPEHLLVGFVGRLETAKGTQVLARLARKIEGLPIILFVQFPGWEQIRSRKKLWGDYLRLANEIRQYNPHQVVVEPDLHPRATERPVRFFDVLILPSLSEVQPLVILEALASGIPVISTVSTPFLPDFKASMPDLAAFTTLFDLPSRLHQGDTPRSSSLRGEEVEDLASKMLDQLNQSRSLSFGERERVSATLLEHGFSEAAMNLRLSAIFEQAIEQFNISTKPLDQMKRYPLTEDVIRRVPEQIGVLEFYDSSGRLIGTGHTLDQQRGLRGLLQSASKDQATFFRFEISDDPQARELELKQQPSLTRPAKPA